MDANEDVDNPCSKITCLFTKTGLTDLHAYCYPATRKPATYQRGSSPIDIIAGTRLFVEVLQHAWILPFGLPPLIKGDHRMLGVDFDPKIRNKPATPAPSLLRGVNSNHEQHVDKFCKEAIIQCNKQHLSERLDMLMLKPILLPDDILELETIDVAITKILVMADQHCNTLSNIPWSLTVQHAFIKHCYWSLCLAAFHNKCDLKSSLKALAARL